MIQIISVCVQLVLILSQLQTAIINILALNGTIACAPPFSSKARGYSTSACSRSLFALAGQTFTAWPFPRVSVSTVLSQQLLILEMFIITLVTRLLYRRQYEPLPGEECDDNENSKMMSISGSA